MTSNRSPVQAHERFARGVSATFEFMKIGDGLGTWYIT